MTRPGLQLALCQGLCNGGAVTRDERGGGSGADRVEGAGNHILPGAGFTGHEHSREVLCQTSYQREDLQHHGVLADHPMKLACFLELPLQRPNVAPKGTMFLDLIQEPKELCLIQRVA